MLADIVFSPKPWDQVRDPRQAPLPYASVSVFGPESTSPLTIALSDPRIDSNRRPTPWTAESSIYRASGEANYLSPMYAVIPARQAFLPGTLRLDRFMAGYPLKGSVEFCPPGAPCSTTSFETPWRPSAPNFC